jgi:hypothetical protein
MHSAAVKKTQASDLYVNGKLDTEAYFRFLDEYWAMIPNKEKREPIIIKNRKL